MKIVIFDKTLFFTIYSYYLDPVSSFKYFCCNIKQKWKFKSLLLDVLCANFGHFLSRHYLKLERSRSISRKMFSLVPGDVLCDLDEVFEVFVDIDSDLSSPKNAYLALLTRSS